MGGWVVGRIEERSNTPEQEGVACASGSRQQLCADSLADETDETDESEREGGDHHVEISFEFSPGVVPVVVVVVATPEREREHVCAVSCID